MTARGGLSRRSWTRAASAAAWLVCGVAAAGRSPLAAAEEIGTAIVVRSVVEALPIGQPARRLVLRDPIESGLRVLLPRPDSMLRVGFHDGGAQTFDARETRKHQIFAVATASGPGEIELGQRRGTTEEGGFVTTLKVLYGGLLFRLSPGRRAEAVTPEGIAGLKGTFARLLVDPELGTFIAVDEGTVEVQAHAGGAPVVLTAGQWVLIPPGGLPVRSGPRGGDEEVLEDPPLLDCCTGTDLPKPPQER